jgi:hypothetical protein
MPLPPGNKSHTRLLSLQVCIYHVSSIVAVTTATCSRTRPCRSHLATAHTPGCSPSRYCIYRTPAASGLTRSQLSGSDGHRYLFKEPPMPLPPGNSSHTRLLFLQVCFYVSSAAASGLTPSQPSGSDDHRYGTCSRTHPCPFHLATVTHEAALPPGTVFNMLAAPPLAV